MEKTPPWIWASHLFCVPHAYLRRNIHLRYLTVHPALHFIEKIRSIVAFSIRAGRSVAPMKSGFSLKLTKPLGLFLAKQAALEISCHLSYLSFFKLSVIKKVTPIVFWRLKNDKEILYNRLPPYSSSHQKGLQQSLASLSCINIYKCTLHLKLHYSKVSYKIKGNSPMLVFL